MSSTSDQKQFPFAGQVAVVTGAASGLGAATALQLLAGGADVIVTYRSDRGMLAEIEAAAASAGRRFMAVQGDVASDDDCVALAKAASAWGRVDILINNAGTTKHIAHGDLDGMLSEDFRHIMDVNVIGAFQVTRALRPLMDAAYQQAGKPRAVVMVSSVAGVIANGSSIAYSASKAALNNMTIALARVLAPAIRVNAICPGYIDTPWFEKGAGAEQAAKVKALVHQHMPLKTAPSADDMARSVIALCSEDLLHMTGVSIVVDDGLSLLIGS
jgi:3-oxoacyl-[acyl-carrier protein] reductase